MTHDAVAPASPTDFATRLVDLVTTEGRSAVVLTGPTGMGKSHTLQLFTDRLSGRPNTLHRVNVIADPGQFEQIRTVLTTPNPEPPGLLIADDLDRWPEGLLRQLADSLDRRQMTVIGSARSGRTRLLFSRFRPSHTPTLLELPPCTLGAFIGYARRRLQGPLHEVTAARLVRFSGGNRLCLSELLEQGLHTGRLHSVDRIWCWDGPLDLPPVTFARRWSELDGIGSEILDVLISLPDARPMPLAELTAVHSRAVLQAAEQAELIVAAAGPAGPVVRVRHELDRRVVWAGVPFLRRRDVVACTIEQIDRPGHLTPELGLSAARLAAQSGQPAPPAVLRSAAVEILHHHDPAELTELTEIAGDPVLTLWAESVSRLHPESMHRRGVLGELWTAAWTGNDLPTAFDCARRLIDRGHRQESLVLAALAIGLQLARVSWCIDLYARLGEQPQWSAAGLVLLDALAGVTALLAGDLEEAHRIALRLCRTGTTRPWPLAHTLGTLLAGSCALARALRRTAEVRLAESAVSARTAGTELGLRQWARSALAVATARNSDVVPTELPDPRHPRLVSLLVELNTAEVLLRRELRPAALQAARTMVEHCPDHPLGLLLARHLMLRLSPEDPETALWFSARADGADFALGTLMGAHARAAAAGDLPALAQVATRYAARGMRWLAAETAATALARLDGPVTATPWAIGSRGLIEEIRKDDAVPLWWGQPAKRTDRLTAREEEVAQAAATGQTSAQIAQVLGISPRTIENHLQSVFRKLGIRGRTQLAEALQMAVPQAC